MNAPNAIITSKVANVVAAPRIRPNPARLRKPSPLPLRPLAPNRFKPPKGEKKVFLYELLPPSHNKHTHTHTHTPSLPRVHIPH